MIFFWSDKTQQPMAESEDEKEADDSTTIYKKRRIRDSVGYNELWCHQKLFYYLLYPLLWLLDIKPISKRDWIQIPILTYTIEITQLMMAITFVQFHIQGLETRATLHKIEPSLVALYLFLYTIIVFTICIISLYFLRRFTTNALHYNYFVELSTHLVGYGLLYLCILIQYEWFSSTDNNAWLWFLYLFLYASVTIAVIILTKQFIFKLQLTQNIIKQYDLYTNLVRNEEDIAFVDSHNKAHTISKQQEESEFVSLIESNSNPPSSNEDLLDVSNAYILFDEHSLNELQHEMDDTFWYTIFTILQNMWSIALGLILVECVVYSFIGDYVNLLVRWQEFRHRTSILDDQWQIILFGFAVAIGTCFLEGAIEATLKIPCYQTVKKNEDYRDCCHRFLVFILNLMNDVSVLWFNILSACIGWAIFTPNQEDEVWDQFEWAMIGTVLMILFGVLSQKYKNKKEKEIMNKINKIKHESQNELFSSSDFQEKEKKLLKNVRNLVFYNRLIKVYNTSMAVGVSFAWETFIQLNLENYATGLQGLENHRQELIATLLYAIFIGLLFTQLGLLLTDIKKQRLFEARRRNQREELQAINDLNNDGNQGHDE